MQASVEEGPAVRSRSRRLDGVLRARQEPGLAVPTGIPSQSPIAIIQPLSAIIPGITVGPRGDRSR
jgi:hypothetical protein